MGSAGGGGCAGYTQLHAVSADLLAVGVFEDAKLERGPLAGIDKALHGARVKLAAGDEFEGKKDQTLMADTLGQLPAQRVLVMGLGKREALTPADLRVVAARSPARCYFASSRAMPRSSTATPLVLRSPTRPTPSTRRAAPATAC